jgi:hypothetical protein
MVIFRFGEYGGFKKILERFQSDKPLSVPVVFALIKPFGLCYDLLTVHTIVTYFVPVVVSRFFDPVLKVNWNYSTVTRMNSFRI